MKEDLSPCFQEFDCFTLAGPGGVSSNDPSALMTGQFVDSLWVRLNQTAESWNELHLDLRKRSSTCFKRLSRLTCDISCRSRLSPGGFAAIMTILGWRRRAQP